MGNKIDIIFIDDFAMSLDIDEKIDKNEIMHIINNERSDSEKRNSKKYYNKGLKSIVYKFKSDNGIITVKIPDKYRKENKEYIEKLDTWYLADQKRNKKKMGLYIIGTVTIFSMGVKLSAPVAKASKDAGKAIVRLFDDPIYDLENEIKIHTNYGEDPDGRKISSKSQHGCDFGRNPNGSNPSMEESISDYCDEYELGEEVKEAAIRKFDLLYDDNTKEAEEIDLKDIYKQSKNKGRSR